MKFLNTNQLREWDEFTILNEPISSIKLVERASQNAINFIIRNLILINIFAQMTVLKK
jgi:NAD(P)H-hydrate epimerase